MGYRLDTTSTQSVILQRLYLKRNPDNDSQTHRCFDERQEGYYQIRYPA
ncbi:hypothetical protein [Streptococcus minor]|nr:hypothetical protein [Streptococcus minor]